jgi:uncharacterized membrane protein
MNSRPLIVAGMVLGIGMGGFIDGIVFHQLLQVHNMLSAKFPVRDVSVETLVVNLQINMFWDGVFHAFTWIVTAIGIAMLWRVARRHKPLSNNVLLGSLALGWGSFNLVEGIINHHIFHIHHVTEANNHLIWDLMFLGSGIVLSVIGTALIRSGLRKNTEHLAFQSTPG